MTYLSFVIASCLVLCLLLEPLSLDVGVVELSVGVDNLFLTGK